MFIDLKLILKLHLSDERLSDEKIFSSSKILRQNFTHSRSQFVDTALFRCTVYSHEFS